MKRKKQTTMMATTTAKSDYLTLFHTGVIDEQGKELVVTCGYAVNGKFGYFIVKQQIVGTNVVYSDLQVFFEKTNEKVYQKALKYLKEVVLNKN